MGFLSGLCLKCSSTDYHLFAVLHNYLLYGFKTICYMVLQLFAIWLYNY